MFVSLRFFRFQFRDFRAKGSRLLGHCLLDEVSEFGFGDADFRVQFQSCFLGSFFCFIADGAEFFLGHIQSFPFSIGVLVERIRHQKAQWHGQAL